MKILFTVLSLSLLTTSVIAQEKNGNGGDICEDRFLEVRNNIKAWINVGNYIHLNFNKSESGADYRSKMLDAIQLAMVRCTDDSLFVGKAEKDCVNAKGTPDQITCNRGRFNSLSEVEQYRLVHHEYAGLSGFEVNDKPNKEESDYHLSDQITGQLEDVVVKRLPILPVAKLYINFIQQKNGNRKLALRCETDPCNGNYSLVVMERNRNGTYSQNGVLSGLNPNRIEDLMASIQKIAKVRVLPRVNFGTDWAGCVNCDNYDGWVFNFTRGLWSVLNNNDLGDARIPAIIGASALTLGTGPLDVASTIVVDSASVVTWPFRQAIAFTIGKGKRARRVNQALQVFTSPGDQNATVTKKEFDLILRGINGY